MTRSTRCFLIIIFFSTKLVAQSVLPPSNVNFGGFLKISNEVQEHREKRMLEANEFVKMAEKEGVMIVDSRSRDAFQRTHIKGAINLPFSDFTQEKLASIIPSFETTILIYCNNNIGGEMPAFPSKLPTLALNVPTFINLYGYGYRNVYELSSLIEVNSGIIPFEGTDVK